MLLIDKYLPHHHFSERHTLDIRASQAEVMAAVLAYRPEHDRFFRIAIALRELPMRTLGRLGGSRSAPPAPFGMQNFSRLEQVGEAQLVFGLVGKFWRLDYGQVPIPNPQTFLSFDEAGTAKLALAYVAEKIDDTHTRLSTETRVFCVDQEAHRKFAPYWYLIRPVSGMIRRRMLASIRQTSMTPVHAA